MKINNYPFYAWISRSLLQILLYKISLSRTRCITVPVCVNNKDMNILMVIGEIRLRLAKMTHISTESFGIIVFVITYCNLGLASKTRAIYLGKETTAGR